MFPLAKASGSVRFQRAGVAPAATPGVPLAGRAEAVGDAFAADGTVAVGTRYCAGTQPTLPAGSCTFFQARLSTVWSVPTTSIWVPSGQTFTFFSGLIELRM